MGEIKNGLEKLITLLQNKVTASFNGRSGDRLSAAESDLEANLIFAEQSVEEDPTTARRLYYEAQEQAKALGICVHC